MKALWIAACCLPLLFGTTSCGNVPHDVGLHASNVVVVVPEDRGWLGVAVQDVTPRLARKKDLKVEEGASVTRVEEDSPAEDAGIREGDVIIEFDGKHIRDSDALIDAVRATKPGTDVSIIVVRGDERTTVHATIERRPKLSGTFSFRIPPMPPIPHIRVYRSASLYGLEVETLTKQLADYFGAPNRRGVLVKSVRRGSDAERAGFKAGDVILSVGKETIADVNDLLDALDEYDSGESVEVEILRKGVREQLRLTIKQRREMSLLDEEDEVIIDLCEPESLGRWQTKLEHLKERWHELKHHFQDRMEDLQQRLKRSAEHMRIGLPVSTYSLSAFRTGASLTEEETNRFDLFLLGHGRSRGGDLGVKENSYRSSHRISHCVCAQHRTYAPPRLSLAPRTHLWLTAGIEDARSWVR